MSTFVYALLNVLSVFINTVSQVMLKKSALKSYKSHLLEYLNPLVIGAYFLSTATTVLTSFTYKGISLALGGILSTTGYIFIAIFGAVIFKEKLTKKKLLALGLIVIGVIVYAIF